MAGGIKTDNVATNWLIDRVNNSMVRNSETGEMEATGGWGVTGSLFNLNLDSIGTNKKTNVNNTAANDLIASSTYTREDLGFKPGQKLTESGVKSAVKALEKAAVSKKEEELRGQVVEDRNAGFKQANEVLAAQLRSQTKNNEATLAQQSAQHKATLTSQQNQFAHTSEQNALTRRHENERADKRDSLSLQMQVMQNDLAEKRMDYDRETARMDKRSAAIAQLMSGLGSLGGAFSL